MVGILNTVILWTLVLGTAFNARAAEAPLPLAEALERARARHPDLGPQQARIELAEARRLRARNGKLPKGELTTVFGLVNGAQVGEVPGGLPEELAPLFSEDDVNDVFNDLNFFLRTELRINQPIYSFGKIRHGIKAAGSGIEAETAELERQTKDVELEVKRIYYGYQLTLEVERVLEDVEEAFSTAVGKAREALQKGDLTQGKVLELELALTRTKQRRVELEKNQQEALFAFRRATGHALTSSITPAGKLRPIEVQLDPEQVRAPLESLPAIRAARHGAEARAHDVDRAKANFLPDFFVSLFVQAAWAPGRDDITNQFLFDPFNIVRAGPVLGLNWDVDFGKHDAELKIARARAAEVQAKLERARTGVPLAIERAMLAFEEKREVLNLARRARRNGRALSFLALANAEIGLGDPKEILESLGDYAKAATGHARAVMEYNMAVAELSQAIGVELDPSLASGSRP